MNFIKLSFLAVTIVVFSFSISEAKTDHNLTAGNPGWVNDGNQNIQPAGDNPPFSINSVNQTFSFACPLQVQQNEYVWVTLTSNNDQKLIAKIIDTNSNQEQNFFSKDSAQITVNSLIIEKDDDMGFGFKAEANKNYSIVVRQEDGQAFNSLSFQNANYTVYGEREGGKPMTLEFAYRNRVQVQQNDVIAETEDTNPLLNALFKGLKSRHKGTYGDSDEEGSTSGDDEDFDDWDTKPDYEDPYSRPRVTYSSAMPKQTVVIYETPTQESPVSETKEPSLKPVNNSNLLIDEEEQVEKIPEHRKELQKLGNVASSRKAMFEQIGKKEVSDSKKPPLERVGSIKKIGTFFEQQIKNESTSEDRRKRLEEAKQLGSRSEGFKRFAGDKTSSVSSVSRKSVDRKVQTPKADVKQIIKEQPKDNIMLVKKSQFITLAKNSSGEAPSYVRITSSDEKIILPDAWHYSPFQYDISSLAEDKYTIYTKELAGEETNVILVINPELPEGYTLKEFKENHEVQDGINEQIEEIILVKEPKFITLAKNASGEAPSYVRITSSDEKIVLAGAWNYSPFQYDISLLEKGKYTLYTKEISGEETNVILVINPELPEGYVLYEVKNNGIQINWFASPVYITFIAAEETVVFDGWSYSKGATFKELPAGNCKIKIASSGKETQIIEVAILNN